MLSRPRLAVIVALLIFLQVDMSASTAPPLTANEEEVVKVSRAWLDARNHRDLEAFAAFMSDDFIGSTDIGERTTKEWTVDWLSKRRPEGEQKVDLRDVQVHLEGDTAIVNYLITVRKGWGKTVVINNRRRTEVFKKNSEKWLAIAAHESDLPAGTTSSQSKSTPRFSRTTRGTMTGPVTASTTGIRSLSRTVTCSANGGV